MARRCPGNRPQTAPFGAATPNKSMLRRVKPAEFAAHDFQMPFKPLFLLKKILLHLATKRNAFEKFIAGTERRVPTSESKRDALFEAFRNRL